MRQTIEELGGTMPEDLPTPEDDLKKLEQRARPLRMQLSGNSG